MTNEKPCGIIVRDVEESDAASIASIYNHYILNTTATFDTQCVSAEEILSLILSIQGRFPFIVAIADEAVVAFCYAHPWKKKAAYGATLETTIYLHPDYCGREIGGILMKRLIKECRQSGIRALIACITSENEGSIRFHEKLGFEKVSRFRAVGEKLGRLLDVTDLELLL